MFRSFIERFNQPANYAVVLKNGEKVDGLTKKRAIEMARREYPPIKGDAIVNSKEIVAREKK